MAGRRADVLDIRELIRRVQLGEGDRQVARDLGVSRKTVAKYREWADREGVLAGPLPEVSDLLARLNRTLPAAPPPRAVSTVEPHRERVVELRRQGVECRAVLERLREESGFKGSYGAVYRFVRSLEPATPEAFVRVETPPGDEAQVDFGYAGLMFDPRDRVLRRAWAFVMTLSFSRHQYVEFVFDQEVGTWLRCHRNAFEWFGGVPRRIVPDNLKSAVKRAPRGFSAAIRAARAGAAS